VDNDEVKQNEVDKTKEIIELLKVFAPLVKTIASRKYGIVHKRDTVEINGVKGFLVWDYIVYNEITFEDMDGNLYSCFSSFSDKETEEEWNKLIQKFKV
jgi:hypothetical protein